MREEGRSLPNAIRARVKGVKGWRGGRLKGEEGGGKGWGDGKERGWREDGVEIFLAILITYI